MNFLKNLFQIKDRENNLQKVKENIISDICIKKVEDIYAFTDGYENMAGWWNSLSDDWKRMLLMRSPNDLEDEFDITVIPKKIFFEEIFEREIFNSYWQKINSLKPMNSFKKLKSLIINFIEVKDFREISDMIFLEEIIADNSKVEYLDGLENFDNLRKLTIANTDVSTLIPIATLKNISYLDIRGTLIHPDEVFSFKSLHPSIEILFVTPINPLRHHKNSLENYILDYYRKLLDNNLSIEIISLNEGINLFKDNKFEDAIKKFDFCLLHNPINVNCLIQRGFSKQKIGDLKGAIIDFDLAIQNDNNKST